MLDNNLQDYVNQKVASGQFGSPEEFATEAIRVYRSIETKHAELVKDVGDRIEQADGGDVSALDITSLKRQLSDELNSDGSKK